MRTIHRRGTDASSGGDRDKRIGRLDHRLLGNAIYAAAGAIVTFGLLQHFFVPGAGGYTTFYSSH